MVEIIEVERRLGFILKEKQMEVIGAFVKGNNVFAVLPTGFGKTLSVSTGNAVNSIVNILRVLDSDLSSLYSGAETQEQHILPTYPSS